MVNSLEIVNGGEGMCSVRIRHDDGSLAVGKLQKILDEHPDCLMESEAKELLTEVLAVTLENEEELRALQRQVAQLEADLAWTTSKTTKDAQRDLKRNAALMKQVSAKKPRQVSRETIRRAMLEEDDAS